MSDIRFIAKAYLDRGWAVVPLVKGEKRANSQWQTKVFAPSDFGPNDGIALKCGEPSGWLVDVDLDSMEAVEAARYLLPNTGLMHGRPGKPDSHYWFTCESAKSSVWKDVKDTGGQTATLLEIRSTGGYTAVPPSGHPSGDTLEWVSDRDPMRIQFEELSACCTRVGLTAVIARHWPGPGARHHFVGHLVGFLLQNGVDPMWVVEMVRVAAVIAKDPDVNDRVVFAQGTLGKWQADKEAPLTGGPKLAEAIGEDVVARMRSWLGVKDIDALETMNAKHFWVRLGKDDCVGRVENDRPVFQRVRALYSEYANQQIVVGQDKKGEPQLKPLFQAWLEWPKRRTFREVVFTPPPRIANPLDFNLWTGFSVEPAPGDCSLFLAHIFENLCSSNQEHYEYLLDWCALMMQAPGVPPGVAVVLRGKQGTGKGVFARALCSVFGRHYSHVDSVQHLTGNFNALLSGRIVVFSDEAFWAGDKREVGSLKRLITEPTLSITRKGIDSVMEDNAVHLVMATNESWAVPAGMEERRFFVLDVSDLHMQDTKYFGSIQAQLDLGGLAGFLELMLKRPVSIDRVRRAVKTEALRHQQELSLALEMQWWMECLEEGTIVPNVKWPDKIETYRLYERYEDYVGRHKGRLLSKVEFSRRMREYFTAGKIESLRFGSKTDRGCIVRDLTDARAYFDSKLGTTRVWDSTQALPDTSIPF